MVRAGLLALSMLASIAVPAFAEQRISAREFLPPELQAQQADDGANPGMLWVQRGEKLWSQPEGSAGKSCVECHGEAATSMRGAITRYPAIDDRTGWLFNIEARINNCRSVHMSAPPLQYESDDLLGLTAYVAFQSRGLTFSPKIDGTAAPHYEAGKRFFYERQGQLNVACNQCHDENVGKHLRGDKISSGLSMGYPVYRLDWQKMGSLHRRLRACALGVRAEQLPSGSSEYINLELYLAVRNENAPVETPGVRK
jgi:L-cysteine S-thiosulfotransferase